MANGEFWLPEWYNRRTYGRTVRPLIDAYIANKRLTRVQFLFAANKTLPKDGRLRRYLFEDLPGELAEERVNGSYHTSYYRGIIYSIVHCAEMRRCRYGLSVEAHQGQVGWAP